MQKHIMMTDKISFKLHIWWSGMGLSKLELNLPLVRQTVNRYTQTLWRIQADISNFLSFWKESQLILDGAWWKAETLQM